MLDELRDLYQEVILDHGKNPRNHRKPDTSSHSAEGYNPMCGDKVSVYLTIENDRLTDCAFKARGCAISLASASLMTEVLKGKTTGEAKAIFDRFHRLLTDNAGTEESPASGNTEDDLERLQVLSGVREFPVRVKCATLPWQALRSALDSGEKVSTE
ncbi:Fe-S cluster assembly sulfur transfer protein SufU [Rhodovibrionaceae bacterium A322]